MRMSIIFRGVLKWLPKTGWANSNAARRRCMAAPCILPKSGWAIAHPAHPPLTPLLQEDDDGIMTDDGNPTH